MHILTNYAPPPPERLAKLKTELDLSSNELAAIACLGQGSQWRKYTGGAEPRVMGPHMLFYLAAQLELPDDDMKRVLKRMKVIGARFDQDQT